MVLNKKGNIMDNLNLRTSVTYNGDVYYINTFSLSNGYFKTTLTDKLNNEICDTLHDDEEEAFDGFEYYVSHAGLLIDTL